MTRVPWNIAAPPGYQRVNADSDDLARFGQRISPLAPHRYKAECTSYRASLG